MENMAKLMEYEGYSFYPDEICGWSYSGRVAGGIWNIVCSSGNFTTTTPPLSSKGLSQAIKQARLAKN